jgi:ABC-2 type transport system permease protein
VALFNHGQGIPLSDLGALMTLSTAYIIFFAVIYYAILIYGSSSNAMAFNMIGIWLLLCVVVPGTVHQYASIKVPVHYMTDYLDVNRKEAYATYSLPSEELYKRLLQIYPTIVDTKLGLEPEKDEKVIQRTISAILNKMNKDAVANIELKNEAKNQIIQNSYWINPVLYVQNKWNSYTSSDYYAYQQHRMQVQQAIDIQMHFLVMDSWNKKIVDRIVFEKYLREMTPK